MIPVALIGRGLRGPSLGIDPSLNRTGWGIVDARGTLMRSGSVRSDPKLPTHARIHSIAYQLAMLWPTWPVKPCHLAIEYQTVGNLPAKFPGAKPTQNIEVALSLSRLQGSIVTLLLVQSHGQMDVIEPTPAEWRKQIGAVVRRDAKKKVTETQKDAGMREVRRRLVEMGIYTTGFVEDQTEAIGLAIACQIEHYMGHYPMAGHRADNKTEKVAKRERKKVREAKKRAAGVQQTLMEGK
jgi:Holliday junction resolvasome RuvABC endonuclease subunit